jgi:hypothetical protein
VIDQLTMEISLSILLIMRRPSTQGFDVEIAASRCEPTGKRQEHRDGDHSG